MTKSKVGICFPDRPAFPKILEAARRVDEIGYESIWMFEARLAHGGSLSHRW